MLVTRRNLEQLCEENLWQDNELHVGKGISLRLRRREQFPRIHQGDRAGGKVLPPEILQFSLEFAKDVVLGVALGLLSNWIYDKVKNEKVVVIRINGIKVEASKEKIKELLIKELQKKTRSSKRTSHKRSQK